MLESLWLIFIAVVPGIFWLWFYRMRDRREPEPLKMIVKVFLWGMLATVPAVALEIAIDYFFPYSKSADFIVIIVSALIVIAPIEELLKYLVIREVVYENANFNEPLDGIIYSITAGLGFATFENIMVAFNQGTNAVLLRFMTATLLHALTSGVFGYYIGLAKFGNPVSRKGLIIRGLVAATLLHGLYNSVAAINTPITIGILIAILVVMFFVLWKSITEMQRSEAKYLKR